MIINFDNDINYLLDTLGKQIKINNSPLFENALVGNIKDTEDVRKLITKTSIKRGDLINYKNNTYIITSAVDNIHNIYKCIMQKCQHTIKIYIDNTLQRIPILLQVQAQGINENKFIDTVNGKIIVTMQYNNITKKISYDNRFIKMGSAWKIEGFTNENKGLLYLYCKKTEFSDNDDKENEIADRWKYEVKHSYTINTENTDVTLNNGKTLQFNVSINDNNVTINNPIISYTSSDKNIATVDENGLITALAEGTSTITATFTGADSTILTKSIIITVIEPVEAHNYTVLIEGSDQAYLSWDNNYSCEFRDNGVAIEGIKAIWKVFAEDGTSSTNLATIKSQTGNSCVLRGNDDYKFGYVILQCQSEDGKIKNTKKIEIISAL